MTMTIPNSAREIQELFAALERGESVTIEKEGQPFLQVNGKPFKDRDLGWSPDMLQILNNPNPNWHLEPEPFVRRQSVTRRDPFNENID